MTWRLTIACRAARAAGKVLLEKFNHTREIRPKGKRDLVTDADYAAERIVRDQISRHFPRDLFLSEEDDPKTRRALLAGSVRANGNALWIVDPLDGTANYAHRIPAFAVSIALYRDLRVQLGVVYDPVRDELFAAEPGSGAMLNGAPIHASARGNLEQAVIGTEWARSQKLRSRTARILERLVVGALSARSTGSAALSLCYVAAGRFDIYYHFSLSAWDIAAGAHIIEQAGGRVTTPSNERWTLHSKAYLASNGHLHPQAIRFFRDFD